MPSSKKTSSPRNTQTYKLKRGNKTVYIGQSDNVERRAAEHRAEEKEFTQIEKTSRRMTEAGAKKKEREQLETYRRNHGGENPEYNKTDHG